MVASLAWLQIFNQKLIPQEIVVNGRTDSGQELKDVATFESVPLRDDAEADEK